MKKYAHLKYFFDKNLFFLNLIEINKDNYIIRQVFN